VADLEAVVMENSEVVTKAVMENLEEATEAEAWKADIEVATLKVVSEEETMQRENKDMKVDIVAVKLMKEVTEAVETVASEEVIAVVRKKEATEVEAVTQKADTEEEAMEDSEEASEVNIKKKASEVAALK
jgi:hypothetical protein